MTLGCDKILKDAQMRLLTRLHLDTFVDLFFDCTGVSNDKEFTVGN